MPTADPELIRCCAAIAKLVGECRKIGVNYNQVMKLMYSRFDDRTTLKYLFRLEKETKQLQEIIGRAIAITENIER